MRPATPDIAAPELPGRIRWLGSGGEAPVMAQLTAAGPVLVHFFDFAQLNSVRALPYVLAWRERYEQHGLQVMGVHTPRFAFTAEHDAMAAGIAALGVDHLVGDDSRYAMWRDYGCKGWPSLFLWAKGGALAWAHFGEGEYVATERAIQDELRSSDVTRALPEPLEPLRASDVPGALVVPPTAELLPGGSESDPWQPKGPADAIEVNYEAGGAFVVADGGGSIRASLDGAEAIAHPVTAAALMALAEHPCHEAHSLRIEADPGVRVWSVSFSPDLPR